MNDTLAAVSRRLATCVAAATLVFGTDAAIAQDTRAEAIQAQQVHKKSVIVPPTRNRAERIIDRL